MELISHINSNHGRFSCKQVFNSSRKTIKLIFIQQKENKKKEDTLFDVKKININ